MKNGNFLILVLIPIYRESVTSRSCEDEESATEEGSSDPQLGWTFYDRVVVSLY